MNCQDTTARFSELHDGRLRGGESAELERHLATCPSCGQEWAQFQETIEALQGLTPIEPSPGFAARVRAQIETPPWYRRLARRLFVPWQFKLPLEVTALVLLAAGTLFVYRRSPEVRQVVERPGTPQPPALIEPVPREAAPDQVLAFKKSQEGETRRHLPPLMGGVSRPRIDEAAPKAKGDGDGRARSMASKPVPPEKSPLTVLPPAQTGAPDAAPEAVQPPPPASMLEDKPATPRGAEESMRSLSALMRSPAPQPFRIMTLQTRDVTIAEERIREWVQQAGGRLVDLPTSGEPVPPDQRALTLVIPVQAVARLDALLAELGQLFGKELEVPRFNEAMISLTISPKSPTPAIE